MTDALFYASLALLAAACILRVREWLRTMEVETMDVIKDRIYDDEREAR